MFIHVVKLLTWLFSIAATKFCAEYFDQQKGDSHPALSVLRQLKSASEQLTLDVSVLRYYVCSYAVESKIILKTRIQ